LPILSKFLNLRLHLILLLILVHFVENVKVLLSGFFNGVGGKIEAGEAPFHAMAREFYEEAGVMTTADNWTAFATMIGPDWRCDCFYTFNNFVFTRVSTQTEEYVCTFSAHPPFPETISNVPWLIAAAQNHQANGREFTLEAKYV
jgi:8-oxo-dGTP pyrophosphatase MutT (NUDIX family)